MSRGLTGWAVNQYNISLDAWCCYQFFHLLATIIYYSFFQVVFPSCPGASLYNPQFISCLCIDQRKSVGRSIRPRDFDIACDFCPPPPTDTNHRLYQSHVALCRANTRVGVGNGLRLRIKIKELNFFEMSFLDAMTFLLLDKDWHTSKWHNRGKKDCRFDISQWEEPIKWRSHRNDMLKMRW